MSDSSSNLPVMQMQGVAVPSLRNPEPPAAEGVDWSVAPGDFWVVGGLQGTGKSDFLLMAGGMTAPSAGSYRLYDERMPIFEEERLRVRLRLGFVFDGGQLLNHLTVRENVSLPLRYHRNLSREEAHPEVERMLEWMGLTQCADSTPGAIARHWQKRAGLARALMLRPDVLLLDNPLGGLDLPQRAWWLACLDQLSKGHAWSEGRPVTLVATADDLRPWRDHARQFAVLKEKHLVVLGSWAEMEAQNHAWARELLAVSSSSV